MKIVQIDTYDITGGAARAAYRLHKALRENGLDCRTVVKNKVSEDDSVLLATVRKTAEQSDQEFFIKEVVQGHYINYHRTQLSNTMFSVPYPGYDVSGIPAVRQADVINLQWVADFQSPKTIKMLLDSGKPVVWTLHDQWAFTGGCHYSAGCENYKEDCLGCPQLSDDPYDLPAAILKDKLEYFNGMDLTIVTPSRWMAKCAGKSRLFADSRIEVISNSLETDLFVPVPKARAKKEIGFDIDSVIILFGAEYGNEKRKGFKELMSAVRHCRTNPGFEKMVRTDKVKIVCFGYPNDELEKIGVPVVPLGYLKSDVEISRAYAAADIFIQPSLEDNLPNTMLESMSCGTPVVAFDAGGMPDMVVENETGRLAPLGDVRLMGEAILSLVFDPDKRKDMSEICRKNILEKYSLDVQARNYLALYDDLHKNYRSRSPVPHKRPALKSFTNGRPGQSDLLFVETGLGRNFQMIIDPVLKKALKEILSIYRERLKKSEEDREKRGEKINELVRHFNESEKNNKKRLDLIRELNKSLKEKDGLIGELDDSLKKRAGLIEELNDSLKEKDGLIGELDDSLRKRAGLIEELNDSLKEKDGLIGELDDSLKKRAGLIEELNDSLKEKDGLIGELDDSLRKRAGLIEDLNDSLKEKDGLIGELDILLKESNIIQQEKEVVIHDLDAALKQRGLYIDELNAILEEREQKFQDLESLLRDKEAAAGELRQIVNQYRKFNPFYRIKKFFTPKLGILYHHDPIQMHIPKKYFKNKQLKKYPRISICTPSYNQALFLEGTIKSVLGQGYPDLEYVIQDGGSVDGSEEILKKYGESLAHWESRKDNGQANAINLGLSRSNGEIMGYLNSDDILLPGALYYVARYFEKHPEVDVIYGHRLLINEHNHQIGRWVLPGHEDDILNWADFIPQETMFWRRRIWEKSGGYIDEGFRFALDWELILRFRDADAKFVRVPRFLAAFRVHMQQKTSAELNEQGHKEMNILRQRCQKREVSETEIRENIRPYFRRHLFCETLYRLGIFRY